MRPEAVQFGARNARPVGKRILVVDDDDSVRRLMTAVLEEFGFTASAAVDGLEGLRMAAAEQFDLLLTDIEMDRLSGLEMIRLLRQQTGPEQLPILVFTGNVAKMQAAIDAGADNVILKPGDINSLINIIDKLLLREISIV